MASSTLGVFLWKGVVVAVRVLEQLIGIRRRWIVLGAGFVGLAFPAGAMAATEHIVTSTVTKTQGFKLRLTLQQGGPTGYGGRFPNETTADLNRTQGHATQSNEYTFKTGMKFKGSANLGYGHMQGTFAQGRGSINMTFHATGSTFTVHVPKGCQGVGGKARRGNLTGTFKMKADNLGTITVKSIGATLSTASYTCGKSPHGYTVFTSGGKIYMQAYKPTSTGPVQEEISVTGNTHGFAFFHTYSVVNEPSSDYSFATNLSTATVTGAGGISGSVSYTGSAEKFRKSRGHLSGDLAVTMATIGKVTPFATTRSALQQKS
jgi:hypothetical protein